MTRPIQLPLVPEEERTPLIDRLLMLIEQVVQENLRLTDKGFSPDLAIVSFSDGAGQFAILLHALCWVHAERLVHKLIPLNDSHRQDQACVRSDLRGYIKWRKVSGGTRSDLGKQCRDTFARLKKTCRKLGISFWGFLVDRVDLKGDIPPLPDVLRLRASGMP